MTDEPMIPLSELFDTLDNAIGKAVAEFENNKNKLELPIEIDRVIREQIGILVNALSEIETQMLKYERAQAKWQEELKSTNWFDKLKRIKYEGPITDK